MIEVCVCVIEKERERERERERRGEREAERIHLDGVVSSHLPHGKTAFCTVYLGHWQCSKVVFVCMSTHGYVSHNCISPSGQSKALQGLHSREGRAPWECASHWYREWIITVHDKRAETNLNVDLLRAGERERPKESTESQPEWDRPERERDQSKRERPERERERWGPAGSH